MSIEDQLAALTAAVKENTEVQKGILAKISGAAPTSTAAADKASTEKTETAPAETKPKGRGRAAAEPKAPKIPTVKELSDKTTGYLDVEDDAEYEERAALVIKITEYFSVKKMSEIGDDDRTEAMEMLEAAIAGDDPFAGKAEKEEEPKTSRRQSLA